MPFNMLKTYSQCTCFSLLIERNKVIPLLLYLLYEALCRYRSCKAGLKWERETQKLPQIAQFSCFLGSTNGESCVAACAGGQDFSLLGTSCFLKLSRLQKSQAIPFRVCLHKFTHTRVCVCGGRGVESKVQRVGFNFELEGDICVLSLPLVV